MDIISYRFPDIDA